MDSVWAEWKRNTGVSPLSHGIGSLETLLIVKGGNPLCKAEREARGEPSESL